MAVLTISLFYMGAGIYPGQQLGFPPKRTSSDRFILARLSRPSVSSMNIARLRLIRRSNSKAIIHFHPPPFTIGRTIFEDSSRIATVDLYPIDRV